MHSRRAKYPYAITLPKHIELQDTVYKEFDIVYQEHVLNRWLGSRTIRSAKPFSISVIVKGKTYVLRAKYANP